MPLIEKNINKFKIDHVNHCVVLDKPFLLKGIDRTNK
jgi:hypothetical protein